MRGANAVVGKLLFVVVVLAAAYSAIMAVWLLALGLGVIAWGIAAVIDHAPRRPRSTLPSSFGKGQPGDTVVFIDPDGAEFTLDACREAWGRDPADWPVTLT